MKLQIGMYVRLERCQGIRQIADYEEDSNNFLLDQHIFDEWGDDTIYLDEADIIGEPSYNVVDLLEVGDYVNRSRIKKINRKTGLIFCEKGNISKENYGKIYSIATGEEFMAFEYSRHVKC